MFAKKPPPPLAPSHLSKTSDSDWLAANEAPGLTQLLTMSKNHKFPPPGAHSNFQPETFPQRKLSDRFISFRRKICT